MIGTVRPVPLDEQDELTAAAIARLAGVGRAAVSNWRRRYPDFPQPTGGSPASPTFSRSQVLAWLTATGKADQLATAGRTDTGTHLLDDPADTPPAHGHPAHRQPDPAPERAFADLTSGQLLAKVMVSLLPRSTAADDPAGAEGAVVLDPACGNGTALLAAADRFGDRVRLVGQEVDERVAQAAVLNLRRDTVGAPAEIHVGDSLVNNHLAAYLGSAAAVVCEPPFDSPQWPSDQLTTDPRWRFGIPAVRDGELAWVQHCYAHLRPRGVAVVAVTPRTCVQPSGKHVRAALVRTGALRDVIALPAGMGSLPDTDVYLWVLQRPHGRSALADVRMIDLSGVADPADVPHDFAAWERLLADGDPAVARSVHRVELLDGSTSLLPSRYVRARAEATAGDLAGVTDRLQDLYNQVGALLPRLPEPPLPVRHTSVTLGELERAGALTIRSRETTPRAGDVLLRTLGRPPVVATGTDTDDAGLSQVVELDPARLDPHFVAVFLRVDANALPVANTLGALSREDLRRCRIPRLPLAEQRRYGDTFRHLHEVQAALTSLAKVSANVIDQTIHSVTTGALAPSAVNQPKAR